MKQFRKLNIKDFGAKTMIIPLKAGSEINERGELIKTRHYGKRSDPLEISSMSDRNLYEGKLDFEERKCKHKKPKTKRCKCNKK